MARPSPGSDDHSNALGINDKFTKTMYQTQKAAVMMFAKD